MAELRPDTAFDRLMQLAINIGGLGLFVGLIVLVVATIIHEAG